jgi:hypothetical protein
MNSLNTSLVRLYKQLVRFRLALFLLFVAVTYGFLLWRIVDFSNVPPDNTVVTQTNAARPHIDQATVDKINQLQDNSVNVQTLFNQARQNPFHE